MTTRVLAKRLGCFSLCIFGSVLLVEFFWIYCDRFTLVKNSDKKEHFSSETNKVFDTPDQCSTSLVGPLEVNADDCSQSFPESHLGLEPGGSWKPDGCLTQERTAIIVPYRNRSEHLSCLLHFLIPVLKRQRLNFRIFIVEQEGNTTFNKGVIMNAAFNEAWMIDDFDCFIFHDVDLLPEDDRNMYTCSSMPRHLSVAVDKFKYKLPYTRLVGGVLSMRREHFLKVNGYSNLYWGWGAEDDDMYARLTDAGYMVRRPPVTIARYKMIPHKGRSMVPVKLKHYLLRTVKKRYHQDGLNSVHYNITFIHNKPLYTHIMVNVGKPSEQALHLSHHLTSMEHRSVPKKLKTSN